MCVPSCTPGLSLLPPGLSLLLGTTRGSPASSGTRSPEHPSLRTCPQLLARPLQTPGPHPASQGIATPLGVQPSARHSQAEPLRGRGDKGPDAAGVQPPSLTRVLLRVRGPTLCLSPGTSQQPGDGAGCGFFPGGFPASLSPVALQFR